MPLLSTSIAASCSELKEVAPVATGEQVQEDKEGAAEQAPAEEEPPGAVAVVAAASVAAAVVVAAAAVIAISIGAGDCRSHRNTDLALAAENADERPVRDLSANRQGVVLQ